MNAIMPSAGPKGMSGIGAIPVQSPAVVPQGKSPDNMGQVMAMARKMSDMQLADVLSGKNMDVPQFAAMTEAMGRKSLRTAMQGAQAQGQLQKPNLKQQTLADLEAQQAPQMAPAPQMQQQSFMAAEGGLASLPAPNMDSMDMAEGGIVAFAEPSNKQEVKDPNLTEEEKARLEQNDYMKRVQAISNPGEAISKWWNERPSSNELWKRGQQARTGEIPAFVGTEPTVKGNLVNQGLVSSDTPIPDVKKVATANALKATAPTVYDVEDARAGMPAALSAKQASAAPSTTGAAPSATPQTTTDLKFQKRANPFGELNAEVPDYAKVKSQGLGEGLMQLSAALFSTSNFATAMSKGLPLLAATSGATRKEVADLKKDYKAQQLNVAKANEFFEQGQEDLGFKHLAQSQNHAVDIQKAMAAMIAANKPDAQMQLFNLVQKQNPGMSATDIMREIAGAKNEPKSDQALQTRFASRTVAQKMVDEASGIKTYDQWLKANGLGTGSTGATMADNTSGFSAVYGPDNKRIK